jgi:acyl carrier protein
MKNAINRRALELADPDKVLEQIRQTQAERPALTAPYREPGSDEERTLAQIFSEVLRVERVGLDDNFYTLGGDSLLATQVISKANEAFQVELPLKVAYEIETFTVWHLAQTVRQLQIIQADPGELERALAEISRLSADEVAALLADED